jgi:hypothetical protein
MYLMNIFICLKIIAIFELKIGVPPSDISTGRLTHIDAANLAVDDFTVSIAVL